MALTTRQRDAILGISLFAVALLLCIPAIRSGFIWDDNNFLTDNAHIHAVDGL